MQSFSAWSWLLPFASKATCSSFPQEFQSLARDAERLRDHVHAHSHEPKGLLVHPRLAVSALPISVTSGHTRFLAASGSGYEAASQPSSILVR